MTPKPNAVIVNAMRTILHQLGENVFDDPNMIDTPERVAKWLSEYSQHVKPDLEKILTVTFDEGHRELVAVTHVTFTALCAHHMLPFRGVAHVGYIPDGKVLGLSKLARLVHYYAERLTLQERITTQIANSLMEHVQPLGCAVVLEAEHQCMSVRGVKEPKAITVTSAMRGVFLEDDKHARGEFMALIPNRGGGR